MDEWLNKEGHQQSKPKHAQQQHEKSLGKGLDRQCVQAIEQDRGRPPAEGMDQAQGAEDLADALRRDMLRDGTLDRSAAEAPYRRDEAAQDEDFGSPRDDVTKDAHTVT